MDMIISIMMTVEIILLVFLLWKFIISPLSRFYYKRKVVLRMEVIVTFGILLIFVFWLHYEMRKAARLSGKGTMEFWKKERSANLTRRSDLNGLDFITISLDFLPMADLDDPTINSYRDKILDLSDKKIVNLTGITNTELKLQYGAANINLLMEYDNNYTLLVSILQKWGDRLYKKGYYSEAASVLEYAVKNLTDAKSTYILLAKIYKEQNFTEKIDQLIEAIPLSKVIHKEDLAEELRSIKNS